MRVWFILLLTLSGLPGAARANPIVVDEAERPIQMLAEKVEVSVGDADSLVKGVYRYRQLADNHPGEPDTHVQVLAPVFLPTEKSGFALAQKEASPVAIVNGKEYQPAESSLLLEKSKKAIRRFPGKSELVFFVFAIPRTEIGDVFEVTLRYRQPHYRGVFASYALYCPMILPAAPAPGSDDFVVTFRPQAGQLLDLTSTHRRIFRDTPAEISISASHLENMVVKVKPARKAQ